MVCRLFARVWIPIFVLVLAGNGCGAGDSSPEGCRSDGDCAAGLVCRGGVCLPDDAEDGGMDAGVQDPEPVALGVTAYRGGVILDGPVAPVQPVQFLAEVEMSDGAVARPYDVAWTVLDPAVAGIDAQGVLRARAPGTVRVRAGYRGLASDPVPVVFEQPDEVRLHALIVRPDDVVLTAGDTLQLEAVGVYDDLSRTVKTSRAAWSSSDEEVITVRQGLLGARAPGSALVTARLDGIESRAVLAVVAPPEQGATATATVGAGGGEIVFGALRITFPPGALAEDTRVTVARFALAEDNTPALAPAGPHYLVDTGDAVLEKPAAVSIGIDAGSIPPGAAAGDLAVQKFDGGDWTVLPSGLAPDAGRVEAATDGFSVVGLGAMEPFAGKTPAAHMIGKVPYYSQGGCSWSTLATTSMLLKFHRAERKPWQIAGENDLAPDEDFDTDKQKGYLGWFASSVEKKRFGLGEEFIRYVMATVAEDHPVVLNAFGVSALIVGYDHEYAYLYDPSPTGFLFQKAESLLGAARHQNAACQPPCGGLPIEVVTHPPWYAAFAKVDAVTILDPPPAAAERLGATIEVEQADPAAGTPVVLRFQDDGWREQSSNIVLDGRGHPEGFYYTDPQGNLPASYERGLENRVYAPFDLTFRYATHGVAGRADVTLRLLDPDGALVATAGAAPPEQVQLRGAAMFAAPTAPEGLYTIEVELRAGSRLQDRMRFPLDVVMRDEVCNDGKDNDTDGLTDCEDPQCCREAHCTDHPACGGEACQQTGCALAAEEIQCGQVVSGATGGAGALDQYPSCAPGQDESGPEKLYVFHAEEYGQVAATIEQADTDLDVFVMECTCAPDTCIETGNWLAWFAVAPQKTYYIAVDGYQGASGSYTLSLDCL